MAINDSQSELIKPDSEQGKAFRPVMMTQSFSGPLPPPAALEAYEKIHKGAADRIICMAEKQAEHRQSLEKTVIGTIARNERIGMWFALFLTTVLMIIGGILLFLGRDTAGYLAVFAPVVFHAGNYLYAKRGMAKPQPPESRVDKE